MQVWAISVNLTLEVSGKVPDLAVADLLALGPAGMGSTPLSLSSLLSVTVVDEDGQIGTWYMSALVSGLGMVTVIVSASFRCTTLVRVTEISYLTSVREVLDTWSLVHRTSSSQQLTWFPFSELAVISHTSPLARQAWTQDQPRVNLILELISVWLARFIRRLNLLLFSSLPLFSSILARVQFISLWTAARHRSDFSHHPVHFCHCDSFLGSTWLVPLLSLPPLLQQISSWSATHPSPVTSPLLIQTLRMEGEEEGHQPYLSPRV